MPGPAIQLGRGSSKDPPKLRRVLDFLHSLVTVTGDFLLGDITIGRGEGSVYTNAAFGRGALASNTTGEKNTAVGINTLASCTTGSNNVAVGLDALTSLTEASSNVAIGPFSGDAITTGDTNIAIGSAALTTLTTAIGNIAIGKWSLRVCATGTENVAIGASAAQQTTGDYNVCLGSFAGTSGESVDSNVCVGYYALAANNAGSVNVAVGQNAGRYQSDGSTPLTSPENCVYVGGLAKGLDNSDDNCTVLGYNAIGKGANTVVLGNTSHTRTYLFGAVNVESQANSSEVEGDHWNDSTQISDMAYIGGMRQPRSAALWTSAAATTVANTDTETTLLDTGVGSKTVKSALQVAGKRLKIRLAGLLNTKASSAGDATLRFKWGATTVHTLTFTPGDGLATTWSVDLDLCFYGSGDFYSVPEVMYSDTSDACKRLQASVSQVSLTAADKEIDVTWEWATADADNSVSVNAAVIEILN